MNRHIARKIAETITNEQLQQMFETAKSKITNWTQVSNVNKGITKGVAWNVLAKDFDVNKTHHILAKINMMRNENMNEPQNQQSCQTSVMVSADLINKIHNENCLETMAKMPDNFIDLTVTSPPYDGLRTYKGYSFDFESIAKELYRVTKQGGVVVWIVGDATVKGSESGTSFKQALYFKEIGFNLHDTMIYAKNNYMPLTHNRYEQQFEYMFILSKGKPKKFNPILIACISKGSKKYRGKAKQYEDSYSERKRDETTITKDNKQKSNIWFYNVGNSSGDDKTKHNAPFPEQLAKDHIISWSNENDIVYDCFAGSGTTAKMSIINNRNWIGSELSNEYCKIIEERIKKAWEEKRKEKDLTQKTLFGDGM